MYHAWVGWQERLCRYANEDFHISLLVYLWSLVKWNCMKCSKWVPRVSVNRGDNLHGIAAPSNMDSFESCYAAAVKRKL